jgi:ubiquinone biosynthesis monooxygenase Coq7
LKNDPCAPQLRHMAAQEEVHLAEFNRLLPEHRVRPTALLPLWHVAGYLLGAGTALMGPRAAMACTAAVESVITEHYAGQLAQEGIKGTPLGETIHRFRDEEMEHHDLALAAEAEQAPFHGALAASIRFGCRLAIRLSERL